MVIEKIQALKSLQAQAAKLEAAMIAERKAELAVLPANYGYPTLKAFIAALKEASGGAKKKGKARAAKAGKRKRAKITPEMREKAAAALKEGKTAAAVAKQFKISPASVQIIKKQAGLVKPRGA